MGGAGGAAGGVYQSSLEHQNSKGAVYPMPSPIAIVGRRRSSGVSSYLPTDQRSPLDMNLVHQQQQQQQQSGYGAVKAEPPSPIASTPSVSDRVRE